MNAVEMVKEICKERNIPISRLERECGFSNGYIGKLKKGYFPIDKAEARKYKGTDKKALYDLVGRNLADWYWTLTEDERRVIWRSVIDQIYFDNDKNIKIVFR